MVTGLRLFGGVTRVILRVLLAVQLGVDCESTRKGAIGEKRDRDNKRKQRRRSVERPHALFETDILGGAVSTIFNSCLKNKQPPQLWAIFREGYQSVLA